MKNKHVQIAIYLAIASMSLQAKPAQAFDLNKAINGFLKQVGITEQLHQKILNDIVGFVPGNIAGKAKDSQGELNIPDLNQTKDKIDEELANSKNLEAAADVKDLTTAAVVKAHGEAITGKEGQKTVIETKQSAQDAVAEIQSLANTAANAQVTQDVVKGLVRQNANLGAIQAQTVSTLEDLKVTTALGNQVSARALEKQVTAEKNESRKQISFAMAEFKALGMLGDYIAQP